MATAPAIKPKGVTSTDSSVTHSTPVECYRNLRSAAPGGGNGMRRIPMADSASNTATGHKPWHKPKAHLEKPATTAMISPLINRRRDIPPSSAVPIDAISTRGASSLASGRASHFDLGTEFDCQSQVGFTGSAHRAPAMCCTRFATYCTTRTSANTNWSWTSISHSYPARFRGFIRWNGRLGPELADTDRIIELWLLRIILATHPNPRHNRQPLSCPINSSEFLILV